MARLLSSDLRTRIVRAVGPLPRHFALAAKGAVSPFAAVRQALTE
jgi:hypothetical protein